MFNKKDEKPEVKKLSLGEMVNSGKMYYPTDTNEILIALRTLKNAIKNGNIRGNGGKHYYLNDVVFGFSLTEEEALSRFQKRTGYINATQNELNRVDYAYSLDELILVNDETLQKEKKERIELKLKQAQEDQKKKVEEIEKLAKELGELE